MQEAKIGETTGNKLINTDAKRLSLYVLVFAIAFMIFILGPPFLGINFGPYPLMKVADIFDNSEYKLATNTIVLNELKYKLLWISASKKLNSTNKFSIIKCIKNDKELKVCNKSCYIK